MKDIGGDTLQPLVTIIYSGVFRGCDKLNSFTIPQSVTTVGMEAFDNDTIKFENYKNLKKLIWSHFIRVQ